MKFSTKLLSMLFALLLTLSLCIGMTACGEETPEGTDAPSATTTADPAATTSAPDDGVEEPAKATFTFKVVHADGTEKSFEIKTNEETVGAALLAKGLISGEDGDYGLYVKVVDGETADYDVDQSYWSFYIGDEYATTGVDKTSVTDGATYWFKYAK
ncbi:MAG: DUF4430 domain-containing protein [Clostridia bacterium]|nr:DUF4430 domain-containing protein [Clostridia bacterium]